MKEGQTNVSDAKTFSARNKTWNGTKIKSSKLGNFYKRDLRRIIHHSHKTIEELPTLKT